MTDETIQQPNEAQSSSNQPRAHQTLGMAILNSFGEIWCDQVFSDPEDAIAALKAHLGRNFDPASFRLVPATLTVTADPNEKSYPLSQYL